MFKWTAEVVSCCLVILQLNICTGATVVSIVIRLRAGQPAGARDFLFWRGFGLAVGPTQLPVPWILRAPSLGVNRLEPEAGHSHPYNTEADCGHNKSVFAQSRVLAYKTEHARTETCMKRTCGEVYIRSEVLALVARCRLSVQKVFFIARIKTLCFLHYIADVSGVVR
jgi:hypothetical protein